VGPNWTPSSGFGEGEADPDSPIRARVEQPGHGKRLGADMDLGRLTIVLHLSARSSIGPIWTAAFSCSYASRFAFWVWNSASVMTPRSRRSASLTSSSALLPD
jgi:hypothetical protein